MSGFLYATCSEDDDKLKREEIKIPNVISLDLSEKPDVFLGLHRCLKSKKKRAVIKGAEGLLHKMDKSKQTTKEKKTSKTVKTIQTSTAKVQFSTLNYMTVIDMDADRLEGGSSKQEGTDHPETG